MKQRKTPKWQLALCLVLFGAAGIATYCNREAIWPPNKDEELKRLLEAKPKAAASNAFPQPGQGKTARSRTPIPREPRPVFPATPAVALLDFQADTDSYRENLAARQFTDVVQAELGNVPSLRWVERQRLKLAIDELNLSALPVESGAMQLRLGKWLKADLLVRGAFRELGKPSSHLRLEVIDLATGDLAAERQVLVRLPSLSGRLGQTEAAAVAAAAREAIGESVKWLAGQRGSRTVAALFFRNLSPTDRLDYFEDQLLRAMSSAARQAGGVRVLRFPRPALAREEAELAMLGLTDGNPDVWQHVGDLYVWGSYRELNTGSATTVPFEQVDVELTVEAWDGLNLPTTLKETAKVADLPALQQRLIRRVLEMAGKQSNSMISLGARDDLLDLLNARAQETYRNLQSARGQNTQQSMWYKHGLQYVVHLLEVACFLAPDSRDARATMIQRKWGYGTNENDWAKLWARIDAQERLMAMPVPRSQSRREATITAETRMYARFLEQAMILLQTWPSSLPADLPEPVLREWRDAVARKVISLGQRGQAYQSGANDPRLSGFDGEMVLPRLLQLPGDPKLTVQAIESWWPLLKSGYERAVVNDTRHFLSGLEDLILRAYLEAGKSDGIEKLFTLANRDPSVGRADDRRSRRSNVLRDEPSSFDEIQSLQRPPTKFEPPPVAADLRNLQPPLRPVDLELGAPRRAGAVPTESGISSLAFVAGRLWIGTAGRPRDGAFNGPGVLVYDPASDSSVRLSPRLGQHSAITTIAVRNGFVWIGTEADGLFRVDARSLDVKKFGGEQGLLSRRVKSLVQAGDKLFVDTGTAKLSILSGDDGRFTDIDPGVQNAAGRVANSVSLAGHGHLLVCGAVQPTLLDIRSGQARLLSTALTDAGAEARNIGRFAADDAAIWVAADGALLRYQPDQRKVQKMSIPRAQRDNKPPDLLLADGDCAWAVYWREGRMGVPFDTRRKLESFILLFHGPSQRCLGMFRVDGTVQDMCASPGRLWLGCKGGNGSVIEVNKLACYGRAGLPTSKAQVAGQPDAADSATGATPLMRQAYLGNLDGVRQLLASGAEVNAATESGWTALMSAAAGGHAEIARELLRRGAQPDAARRRFPKVTALDVAARMGDAEVVKVLLQSGAKPREADVDAEPTLWAAVASGQVAAVEALLDHGTPIMMRRTVNGWQSNSPVVIAMDRGYRDIIRLLAQRAGPRIWDNGFPLIAAASSGDVQLMEELLQMGADLRMVRYPLPPALQPAIEADDVEMARLLLRHGADPNGMFLSTRRLLGLACEEGSIEVLRLLVKAGADVNGVERTNVMEMGAKQPRLVLNTPFTLAAASREARVMEVLLELGADLKRDIEGVRQGDLALIRAARKRQFGIVSVLLHMGYNINARDHNGETALITAAALNDPQTVEGLLELGADPSIATPDGKTALALASMERIKQALRSAGSASTRPATGPRVSPWLAGKHLARATAAGDVMGVSGALAEGADPNAKDIDGWPAIVLAASKGHTPIVQSLLAVKARVDEPGVEGWTALMQAARGGHLQTVELLLKAGAEIQLASGIGRTAHDIAVQHRRADVAAVLEKAGALRQDGRRLIKATYLADPILVRRLLREGAPVDGVDAEGRTAMFYALDGRNKPLRNGRVYRFRPNMQIVTALLEHGANINHRDKRGYTPGMAMFTAVEYHPTADVLRLLLARGADPKIRGADGNTMLNLCLRLDDVEVHQDLVQILREAEKRRD